VNRESWTGNSREPVAGSRGCLVANRLLAHHGSIVRQMVVIPGKLGGESFANEFSGLGLYLRESDLDIGAGEPDGAGARMRSGVWTRAVAAVD
jgi:hypothetical protein